MSSNCEQISDLVRLAKGLSLKSEELVEVEDPQDWPDVSCIALLMINRGVFLENLPILPRIIRDSWRIYSYKKDVPNNSTKSLSIRNNYEEYFVRLTKSQPMKSYLRLTFRQVMNFLLSHNDSSRPQDTKHFASFLNELRISFSTMSHEDRQALKLSAKHPSRDIFSPNAVGEDASFLINWSTIEAAKYCIKNKFSPDISANQLLSLLKREISSSLSTANKISRRFFISLLQNLDKFLADMIYYFSICKHTFETDPLVESWYLSKTNSSIFQLWYSENRQSIAKLGLYSDDPADCWRNTNIKLFIDLQTKFTGYSYIIHIPSLSHLLSLDTKNWQCNLSLLANSAKQLEDISVLKGIKSLTAIPDFLCEFKPLDAMISNLEGSYERTYDRLKDSPEIDDEQVLIELLNACFQLGRLHECAHLIDRLKTEKLRDIYKMCLETKSTLSQVNLNTRLEEVSSWLRTWESIHEPSEEVPNFCSPQTYIDLIVPTSLNIISKVPESERSDIIERIEWLISQDFLTNCVFSPAFISQNVKIYHLLLELLEDPKSVVLEDLFKVHENDLKWNSSLHRHLCDLGLIDVLHENHGETVDLIQLQSLKYHFKHQNITYASGLAKKLMDGKTNDIVRFRSRLLLIQNETSSCPISIDDTQKLDQFYSLAGEIMKTNLKESQRTELILQVLRSVKKTYPCRDLNDDLDLLHIALGKGTPNNSQSIAQKDILQEWLELMGSCDLISKSKTLFLFSMQLDEQFKISPNDDRLLNIAFDSDITLLEVLCQVKSAKQESRAIDCASRLLQRIVDYGSRLSKDNLTRFTSEGFAHLTRATWITLKTNLISIISYKTSLSLTWRQALVFITKDLVQTCPHLLLYSIIVNRLDLRNELIILNDESDSLNGHDASDLLLRTGCLGDDINQQEASNRKLEDCQLKLDFWNGLYEHIKMNADADSKWLEIIQETEKFLKEIRRISFLCGEFLKTLTAKISRRLESYLEYLAKSTDAKTGTCLSKQKSEDCENRLKIICDQATNSIQVLLDYKDRIGFSHLTKYELWFCSTFTKHLRELEYRIGLLQRKRPIILGESEKLIKSITELLAVCRNSLLEYNLENRQKLYMELISPLLSRLEPSLIPMPDCCDIVQENSVCNQVRRHQHQRQLVTIHKISQTVNLLVSKTSPKKMKFTGSDGKSRSFILKAHEDLRLDSMVMEIFGTINKLLVGDKSTMNRNIIRRYSVTPVSFRSGLIQWIDAPSLCSAFRSWLNGPNGREKVGQIFKDSCEILCVDSPPSEAHRCCTVPTTIHPADMFLQLLWVETRLTRHPITVVKPHIGNILKYRTEFDASIFQRIVMKVKTMVPEELIANQLWYNSANAHAFWLKTQEFIHSCATMSMVGYVVGLGDRHPENILLDYTTGQVIHIDYNICFEFGKSLSIPEKVPFRLTPNIIRALQFAGLEGGFFFSCRSVLDVLRRNKALLLHLLDPVNFGFMVGSSNKVSNDNASRNLIRRQSSNLNSRLVIAPPARKQDSKIQLEMDMCSQESVGLDSSEVANVSDLLTLHNTKSASKNLSEITGNDQTSMIQPQKTATKGAELLVPSFDLQRNIKTPTKITENTAIGIHERIRDKLSGNDENIRDYKLGGDGSRYMRRLLSIPSNGCSDASGLSQKQTDDDLILLNNPQATEDQVDALIAEATSIENTAAMYEGWSPWF